MDNFIIDKSINDWHIPTGGHEQELIDMFKIAGNTFVDVGAHLGTWSLRLSPYFKKIIAFEPNTTAYNSLLKNIELNGKYNISAFNKALYKENARLLLNLYETAGHSTILNRHNDENIIGNKVNSVEIEAISLDTYSFKNINLIKIDVEGGEYEVLLGALETITKCKPSLIIEIHGEELLSKCKDLLMTIGIETSELIWGVQKHLIYKKAK